MRRWLIEKLGGYPDIDSLLEDVRELETEEKYKILTLAVKRLFNTIGPDDIFRITEQGWMWKGRALPDEMRKLLIEEAIEFSKSKLWEMFQAELKYQANRKMFLESQNELDLVAGKLWLLSIRHMDERLQAIVTGKEKKTPAR